LGDDRFDKSGRIIQVIGLIGDWREPIPILKGAIEYCSRSRKIFYMGYSPETGNPELQTVIVNVRKLETRDVETIKVSSKNHVHHRGRYLYLQNDRYFLTNTPFVENRQTFNEGKDTDTGLPVRFRCSKCGYSGDVVDLTVFGEIEWVKIRARLKKEGGYELINTVCGAKTLDKETSYTCPRCGEEFGRGSLGTLHK